MPQHSVHELAEEKDINDMTDEFTQFYAEDTNDKLFLGSIDHSLDEMWSAETEVNGHSTKFKLNTRASVSLIKKNEPWLKKAVT